MKKKGINRGLGFFMVLMIVGAVFTLFYLAKVGNVNQVFTDVVDEFTAQDGSNKSAERTLIYLLSIGGAAILGIYYYFTNKKVADVKSAALKDYTFAMTAVSVMAVTSMVLYGQLSMIVGAALALVIITYVRRKELVVIGLSFYALTIYALCGIYRIYVRFGGMSSIKMNYIVIAALVISLILLVFSKDNKIYLKGALVSQVLIPFTLLVFLVDKYYVLVIDAFVTIGNPKRAQLPIYLLIMAFVAEAVYLIVKRWKSAETLTEVLSFGACVSIMSFNRFGGTGVILPSDLHHPYENIIAYSQIVEHGAKPFVDYIPASGLYSFIQGWFFAFFGHGLAAYYYLTENLFYLAAICLTVFLLRKQLKAEWTLFISVVFLTINYSRVAFIVPVMLLLAWPKLIDNKNFWLKAWFLTSFLQGMYYPLFGAAVCFGYLPLGVWQIYTYVKSGNLAKDIKTVKFWAWWIVCFVPVIAAVKILLGFVKHMGAMGGQTVFSDGIARFGSLVPDFMLPYVADMPGRIAIFYILTFLAPASVVWLSVSMFFKNGAKLDAETAVPRFISISSALMLLVSFSYTIIRIDIGEIYSRSTGVILASFVMTIVVIARYMTEGKSNVLWIFGYAVFTVSIVSSEGFGGIDTANKLDAFYTVPDNYVYAKEDRIERFGESFVHGDLYSYLQTWYDMFNHFDKEQAYLGGLFDYGPYYLFDQKGASVMEVTATLRGYEAVQESVNMLRETGDYVGIYINPLDNYYLYHWLVTSGEYVFDNDLHQFTPNDGSLTKEQIQEANKSISLNADHAGVKRAAGSWGSSLESLESIFTEMQVGYNIVIDDVTSVIVFDKTFDGDEADFIYIEFDGVSDNYDYILFDHGWDYVQDSEKYDYAKGLMKKDYNPGVEVVFSWDGEDGLEHSLRGRLDEGKMLMPLGAGHNWLLNRHSDIRITVEQDGANIPVPEIKNIRMLKLREIQ